MILLLVTGEYSYTNLQHLRCLLCTSPVLIDWKLLSLFPSTPRIVLFCEVVLCTVIRKWWLDKYYLCLANNLVNLCTKNVISIMPFSSANLLNLPFCSYYERNRFKKAGHLNNCSFPPPIFPSIHYYSLSVRPFF